MDIRKLKRVSDRAAAEYKASIGDRTDLTGCVLATLVLSEHLESEDFDFDCVLGQASFGFNASEHGCCDYGYSAKGAVDGLARVAGGSVKLSGLPQLPGHAWVEIGDYVVDLTLLTLKKTIRNDDQMNGTKSGPFKLDLSTAPIMYKNRLVSRDHVRDGGIGAHYNGLHRLSSYAFLELI